MHKAFNVILIILLVVALAVPAFASEHFDGMGLPDSFAATYENYSYVVHYVTADAQNILFSNSPFSVNLTDYVVNMGTGYGYIKFNDADTWIEMELAPASRNLGTIQEVLYTSHNILDENGNIYYYASVGQGDTVTITGTWTWKTDIEWPANLSTWSGGIDLPFVSNGIHYDNMVVMGSHSKSIYYHTGNVQVYKGGILQKPENKSFTVVGYVDVPVSFYNWLVANAKYGEQQCDGSSCPATDVDLNNICDDCGNVLTFSLRSTLLEYARSFANDNELGYYYWAIFQIADQYRVYVSQTPMTSPNGVMIEGTNLKYALLYQYDNGSFGYGSWYTGFDVDELIFIESNHTIENFTAPPLAVVIQGVTGEAMIMTLPVLKQTMKILALCGAGCLALLIGLKLFGKRSLLFLKR